MRDELAEIGARLRAVRRSRGLTLEELSERVGISQSTLSRLESGKRQAGLELLLPLTRHLGVRIDDLVSPDSPDPRVRRPVIHRDGLVIAPLAPEGSPIHTYKITYPPVRELPELRVHDGYEWLYVLTGRLRLRLGGQELVLTRGEAAEFDTHVPHAMSAAGGKPAQVISIFNDAGARMHTHTTE
ncbi:helix-turn-helix domain-containing protein [Gulosibacter sp. 10]|uniref:helix-turn-helix domain-containing protein n=1 Tax=Gulosibacter sp. 10 TaxID=1255570 RepID=UPI00097EE1AE|nr:XRE family transcriptional regulator [Gulosibacter sp. 10]SJM61031.1 Cys-tRNA(Pro) deacylase YbaK [Gulosibacter sp. 10]